MASDAPLKAALKLNPWAARVVSPRGLYDAAQLRVARRAASRDRLAQGYRAWNEWAIAMLAARDPGSHADAVWAAIALADFAGATLARIDLGGALIPAGIDLSGAEISGDVWLGASDVRGPLTLTGAELGALDLSLAKIAGDVSGARLKLRGSAELRGVQIGGAANFSDAHFRGDLWARPAHRNGAQQPSLFSGEADFSGAVFGGEAGFGEAVFAQDARFRATQFDRGGGFDASIFAGVADFENARFKGLADFRNARFAGPAPFGGARYNDLRLDGAIFDTPAAPAAAADAARRRQAGAG